MAHSYSPTLPQQHAPVPQVMPTPAATAAVASASSVYHNPHHAAAVAAATGAPPPAMAAHPTAAAAAAAAAYHAGSPTAGATAPPPAISSAVPVPSNINSTTAATSATTDESSSLLWQLDIPSIERWIRGLQNGSLFPKRPKPRLDPASGNLIINGNNTLPANTANLSAAELQEQNTKRHEAMLLQKKEEEEYVKNVEIANRLLLNLSLALKSAASSDSSSTTTAAADSKPNGNGMKKEEEEEDEENEEGPDRKRQKTNNDKTTANEKRDLYSILDPSFARGKDVILIPGAIVTRLTIPGLINALAGALGGVVDVSSGRSLLITKPEEQKRNGNASVVIPPTKEVEAKLIPTASSIPLSALRSYARKLHDSISARIEMDMLDSTPTRIIEMECPENTMADITTIRKRIYDTVVLGRGTGSSFASAALERTDDLPVAARGAVHDIDKWKKCKNAACGNNDQSNFVMDRKNGDLICTQCGTVATESLMHEGSQFRKFEGEADRNHHGDAANPLFSNAYNMSTTLGGLGFQTGAGVGGFGSMQKRGIENVLKNAHMYTEINLSQMGKDEKRTRDGYKNQQKKEAFMKMKHIGDALGLHEAVVQRAKELFAGFRDDRELVQQFKGVVAACLIEAFDQLSKDGRQILKIRTGEKEAEEEEDKEESKDGEEDEVIHHRANKPTNARASRRNDLHSASLAGKGGSVMGDGDGKIVGGVAALAAQISGPGGAGASSNGGGTGAANGAGGLVQDEEDLSPTEKKPAASWDLDDCRSWLREASIAIAKQWSEQREGKSSFSNGGSAVGGGGKKSGIGTNARTALGDIPKGTLDELQGKLIEHTLTLCVYLEDELKKCNSGKNGGGSNGAGGYSRSRVTTPRVKDMGKMSIRWQHSHERGSGGKGGVGNSGRTTLGTKPGERTGDGRTAGQILRLKTSKALGSILEDQVSGDAFYRELRALLGRQEARKKKGLRQEATLQRLKQMNRKQYVLARARR